MKHLIDVEVTNTCEGIELTELHTYVVNARVREEAVLILKNNLFELTNTQYHFPE